MADAYWIYADPRLQPAMAPPQASAAAVAPATAPSAAATPLKRPRSDYIDVPAGPEVHGYYPRDEERTAHLAIRDTESINASYDRYLRNGLSTFGAADPVRVAPGGMTGRPVDDPRLIGVGGLDGRPAGYGSGRPEPALPRDASNTLYVEGLPADCSRREVSHIFRPFVGFREVRLVNKDSRHAGGDPLVLCFVDFANASQATVALEALQGYKFDEHDRDSANLRLQFARFAGPRSASGSRGRR